MYVGLYQWIDMSALVVLASTSPVPLRRLAFALFSARGVDSPPSWMEIEVASILHLYQALDTGRFPR
jgi:hypothetical protein